jgi:glycosyltransferase involved in cell wall biosynthesis
MKNELKMVFAHTGSSCFIGIVVAFLKRIKLVRVRADKGEVKKNVFNRLIHKYASAIVVPTLAIKDDFLNIVDNEDKIFVLPPVVDTKTYKSSPVSGDKIITLVGRLDEVKGHKILIESLPQIKKEIEDLKVFFVGKEEGIKCEELRNYAEARNIDDILFIGFISDKEVAQIMENSRLGVIPSKGSEAVSRVALEWMSSGRPVVASKVGILPEIIEPDYNGCLVEPNDSKELAETVIKILKNKDINDKMGANARKYIDDKFAPEVYCKSLCILMEKVYE